MNNTKNKMLIDATHPEETRVVVLRNGRIEEFDWESSARKLLRGNIYLAKVTRVEPSLQAAFIDYGGNRHGFLAFSEIHPDYYQIPMADRQALLAEEAEAEEAKARAEAAEDAALPEGDAEFESGRNGRRDRNDDRSDEGGSNRGYAGHEDASANQPGTFQPTHETVALDAPSERLVDDRADQRPSSPEAPSEIGPSSAPYSERHAADPSPFDPHADHTISRPTHSGSDDTSDRQFSRDTDGGPDDIGEIGSRVVEVVEPEGSGATEVETVGSEDAGEEIPERPRRYTRQYKIQEVIRRRQIILVQVVKEERGNKGAALTTYLSLAGRYTVLMPNTARGGGISRKIANSADRKRLRKIVTELEVPKGMGLIVRTAGASRTKAEIKRDFEYLLRLWESVRDLTLRSTAPALVYEEGDLIKRSIRDLYSKEIDEIVVAGDQAYANARGFMNMLMPSHVGNVIPFQSPEPLFTKYQIERQLNAMFSPFVTLRSGGYIVINQTEALVSIDINSGKSTREHNIEDTALKTNLEASEEIARQLKLRDLAGLIVIDYIDMEEKRNNRAVERRMKESLRHDRARIQVGRISHFGLLEMSRQRLRPGVLEGSTSQCPHCQGTGTIRSTESVALGVLRGIEDKMISGERFNVVAQTTPDVALYILNQKRHFLNDMESRYDVTISILASDKVHGANYVIERGPANEERQPVRRTDVVQMDASHYGTAGSHEAEASDEDVFDDERVDTVDDTASDEGGAEEMPAEAGGDAERRGRKRRRRRRGGRNGADAPSAGEVAGEAGGRSHEGHADETDGHEGHTPSFQAPSFQAPSFQASGDDRDDDHRGGKSYRSDFGDAEPGVQEIDTDSEVETIGGDGEGDDHAPSGERAGSSDDKSGDIRTEGDRNGEGTGEGRRRRRGRRGGRRGGRDRDQRDGEPSETQAHDGAPTKASGIDLPIARPDEWLHSEPTVGDLAAEERRRTGREDQPAYFSQAAQDAGRHASREPERTSWQQADQQPAGSHYPQVMAGAAALVVASEVDVSNSTAHAPASRLGQSEVAPSEAVPAATWDRGFTVGTAVPLSGSDHRHGDTAFALEPTSARSAAPEPSWKPEPVISPEPKGSAHREAHLPETAPPHVSAVPIAAEPAVHAVLEPAVAVESPPTPEATLPPAPPEPPRPRRAGWWSKRPGE